MLETGHEPTGFVLCSGVADNDDQLARQGLATDRPGLVDRSPVATFFRYQTGTLTGRR